MARYELARPANGKLWIVDRENLFRPPVFVLQKKDRNHAKEILTNLNRKAAA